MGFSQSFATNVNMELVEYVAVNMSEVETVDKDTINKFNNEIGALIVDAAEKTCGTFTKRTIVPTNNTPNPRNQWFDYECKISRKQHHRCRKRHNMVKNYVK